jgi:hypothetical protein
MKFKIYDLRLTIVTALAALCLCVAPSSQAQQATRVLTPDAAFSVGLTNRALLWTNSLGSWICEVAVLNATGADVYVHLFDTNGIPGNGAIPNVYIPVSLPNTTPNSQASIPFATAYPLSRGLAVAVSSTRSSLTLAGTNCWISATALTRPK